MTVSCAHRDDRACQSCLADRRDRVLTCALRAAADTEVVAATIDGVRVAVAFDVDHGEDDRRRVAGLGAITATAVLYGLWLLPNGVPVPVDALPDHKRERLKGAPALVAVTDGQFQRLYEPAGSARAIACGGRSAVKAVERAARFSPIFRRYAAIPPRGASALAVASAQTHRVGLIETDGVDARVVLDSPAPVLGVPAVYRWWVAEVAYEAWLYESTQPVS